MKPFGADGVFLQTAEGGGGVRRMAVRSAGVTVLSSALGIPLQIVSTVTLARLLDPKDFGVVAMVITFSVLLMNFGLNGFTEVVLQWKEMDHSLASNLFWINVGVGCLLTAGFASSGRLIAWFYGTPQVAKVCVGISLTILLTSISVIHLALLKRAMLFTVTSTSDVLTNAISIALTILLAKAHWGYWALVAGAVVRPLLQSMAAWYLCRWLPGLPRRGAKTAAAVRFAMNIYGRFSINYFARNTDNLLVGWKFGAGPLGFYKKAYDLFLLSASAVIAPLTNVAVSALSRFDRHSAQFKKYLLSSLGVTAFVGMALGADLTLVGKDVIRLVLGPKWDAAGQIFTYFGPGVGIMFLYGTIGWIHLSIGTADRWFRWVVAEFAVTGGLFLVGLRWGPQGIAMAWTMSFWILAAPAFWYAGRPIRLGVGEVGAAVWKYILASLLAGCATALLVPRTLFLGPGHFIASHGWAVALGRMILISAVFVALYLGAVIALHRGVRPLYQIAGLLREMVPRRWSAARPPQAAGPADQTAAMEAELPLRPAQENELVL